MNDVEYGIQRRTIYLIPPKGEDLRWIYDCFEKEEVWGMFGFDGPGRTRIVQQHRQGNLVMGLLKRVSDEKRLGFVTMFPPTDRFDFWELGYAIMDPADRDAYAAFNATDAMAHYMFEHLRVDAMGWRTREDNKAADAVVRRLGYKAFDSWEEGGHKYTFYRLDQAGWAKRRKKLDLGEERHPSGLGATFVMLAYAPYTPVQPQAPQS